MVPDRMDDGSMTAADMVPTAAGTTAGDMVPARLDTKDEVAPDHEGEDWLACSAYTRETQQ